MSDIKTLATLVLGGAFDATELGENDIQPDSKLIEELQQRLVTGTDDVYVDLIDRAELERVTAERDALQDRLNATDQRNDELSGMLQHLVDHPFRFTTSYRERIAATLKRKPATPAATQVFTERFIEDHLGKMPDQLRDAAKMIGIERMPPMEYDEP